MKLLLSTLSVASAVESYNGHQVLRALPTTKEQVLSLRAMAETDEFDFWTQSRAIDTPVDIRCAPSDCAVLWEKLSALGVDNVSVMIDDLQTTMHEEKKPLALKASSSVSGSDHSRIAADGGQCCAGACKSKHKYFSISDDTGAWLCGETCIRRFFFPIFRYFEKNLTKATDLNVCESAGYTKYNKTVTQGGGGLDVTLDLYECTKAGGCEHPGMSAGSIVA